MKNSKVFELECGEKDDSMHESDEDFIDDEPIEVIEDSNDCD